MYLDFFGIFKRQKIDARNYFNLGNEWAAEVCHQMQLNLNLLYDWLLKLQLIALILN